MADVAEQRDPRDPIVEVYQEEVGLGSVQRWRWRLRGANGETVCQGEDHRDQHDAIRAATRVEELFAGRPNLVVLRSQE